MTEKTTDLIISKLLDAANIEHYAESCPIEKSIRQWYPSVAQERKVFLNTLLYRVTLLLKGTVANIRGLISLVSVNIFLFNT